MLRIAIGRNAWLSSISRDGQLLPVVNAQINLEIGKPTEVRMTFAESNGSGTSYRFEKLDLLEELEIVGVE